MKTLITLISLLIGLATLPPARGATLDQEFLTPPDSARPWVYFMVMDGNLTRAGITADFEAMKRAGIGGVIFIEVNVGIPRGPVKFMSAEWQDLFAHADKHDTEHAIYATSFQKDGLIFPLVWATDVDWVSAVNITARYTEQAAKLQINQGRSGVFGVGWWVTFAHMACQI
jgi:hypothetical protein